MILLHQSIFLWRIINSWRYIEFQSYHWQQNYPEKNECLRYNLCSTSMWVVMGRPGFSWQSMYLNFQSSVNHYFKSLVLFSFKVIQFKVILHENSINNCDQFSIIGTSRAELSSNSATIVKLSQNNSLSIYVYVKAAVTLSWIEMSLRQVSIKLIPLQYFIMIFFCAIAWNKSQLVCTCAPYRQRQLCAYPAGLREFGSHSRYYVQFIKNLQLPSHQYQRDDSIPHLIVLWFVRQRRRSITREQMSRWHEIARFGMCLAECVCLRY